MGSKSNALAVFSAVAVLLVGFFIAWSSGFIPLSNVLSKFKINFSDLFKPDKTSESDNVPSDEAGKFYTITLDSRGGVLGCGAKIKTNGDFGLDSFPLSPTHAGDEFVCWIYFNDGFVWDGVLPATPDAQEHYENVVLLEKNTVFGCDTTLYAIWKSDPLPEF